MDATRHNELLGILSHTEGLLTDVELASSDTRSDALKAILEYVRGSYTKYQSDLGDVLLNIQRKLERAQEAHDREDRDQVSLLVATALQQLGIKRSRLVGR